MDQRSQHAWQAIKNRFDHARVQQLEKIDMTKVNERVITTRIHELVSFLTPIHPERCIFKVPHLLRHGKEEFYEPKVISIGPYHRGNPCLASMEEHKIRYLQSLLHRTGNHSVDCLVQAVVPHVETVRKCYAESIDYISSEELVQTLVLDGCFIIELMFRCQHVNNDDPVLNSMVLIALGKDMILIENQVPFFILEILFNTINHGGNELERQILVFFYPRLKNYSLTLQDIEQLSIPKVCHLLDIIHKAICFRFQENSPNTTSSQIEREFVNSATKLKEANVWLNASSSSETRSMFDITFKKGKLNIPTLGLDDGSEIEIRNFIALELYQQSHMQRFWCDYVIFMDHLIASSNDVDLLTNRGIFNNRMIDTNSVDNMFKNLTRNIITSHPYTYSKISKDLNDYCDRPWNKWRATLKHNYFNTPWTIISLIAALALLSLTAIQTVFSIIS